MEVNNQGMRLERIPWPDHHMLLALVTAQRSADGSTKVGCCIVSKNNRVLGVGYNGPPKGICPSQIPWAREHKDPTLTKYPYIVHAEVNAILNSAVSLEGSHLYSTLFPCPECMKIAIQKGIRRITYLEDKYSDTWQIQAAKWLADTVDIVYEKHTWGKNTASALEQIQTAIREH